MESIKFEIINEIAVINDDGKWRLELNRISWNGNEPKYDLRKWSPDHTKMGKGVTFGEKDLIRLCEVLEAEKAMIDADA